MTAWPCAERRNSPNARTAGRRGPDGENRTCHGRVNGASDADLAQRAVPQFAGHSEP
jgi:hypothetical protein